MGRARDALRNVSLHRHELLVDNEPVYEFRVVLSKGPTVHGVPGAPEVVTRENTRGMLGLVPGGLARLGQRAERRVWGLGSRGLGNKRQGAGHGASATSPRSLFPDPKPQTRSRATSTPAR